MKNDFKEFCEMQTNKQILNAITTNDWTLLQRAARDGRSHMVKNLIERGALVDLSGKDGWQLCAQLQNIVTQILYGR